MDVVREEFGLEQMVMVLGHGGMTTSAGIQALNQLEDWNRAAWTSTGGSRCCACLGDQEADG